MAYKFNPFNGKLDDTLTIAEIDSRYVNVTGGTINTNSTTALVVEQDGVYDNVLVINTTNGRVEVGGREVIELFRYSFMLGR